MALADLNPRSTAKYFFGADQTGNEGKLLTLKISDTSATGVPTLKLATSATELPVAVVVVGAASDSGSYPGAATSCEVYDSLIGCFDGAIAGAGGVTNGVAVECDGNGTFITATPGAGTYIVGYALTDAAAGEQFTIKFATQLCF